MPHHTRSHSSICVYIYIPHPHTHTHPTNLAALLDPSSLLLNWSNMVFFPYTWRLLPLVVAGVLLASTGGAMGDSSKEKEECTEQLAGLATCLPYVGGQAKSPTPDCCTGLKQLLKNNKKCLCVLIKDRNDPDIGSLQINITLAMTLPNVCNAPSNVSKCPGT